MILTVYMASQFSAIIGLDYLYTTLCFEELRKQF